MLEQPIITSARSLLKYNKRVYTANLLIPCNILEKKSARQLLPFIRQMPNVNTIIGKSSLPIFKRKNKFQIIVIYCYRILNGYLTQKKMYTHTHIYILSKGASHTDTVFLASLGELKTTMKLEILPILALSNIYTPFFSKNVCPLFCMIL